MSTLAALQAVLRLIPVPWGSFTPKVNRWGPLEFSSSGWRISAIDERRFSIEDAVDNVPFVVYSSGEPVTVRLSKPSGATTTLVVTWPDGQSWRFRYDGQQWRYDRFNL